jgi:hypothetical protein
MQHTMRRRHACAALAVTNAVAGPQNPKCTKLQAGVAPHEALLLNSLRVLLSAAPVMEATIAGWCQAGRLERRRAASRPASREGEAPPAHLHLSI